jgi:hypothetical protein
MTAVTVKALRLASVAICLIVAASFLLFALSQTSTASGRQQEEVTGRPAATTPSATSAPGQLSHTPPAPHENGVRKTIDEIAFEVTSPVGGVSSSSEWSERAVRLLFALLVYGFGLGYLARALRVRARAESTS